jgi:hypothetical protein
MEKDEKKWNLVTILIHSRAELVLVIYGCTYACVIFTALKSFNKTYQLAGRRKERP